MVQAQRCPQCGEDLTADCPEGLCPGCLLEQGVAAHDRSLAQSRSSPRISPFIPPEPAELAEDFPQLEILELLGQGGMGAVYKARQKKLDRLVALKILPLETGRDPAFAERFAREARALARLNHPNVIGVHDFGEVGGLYYFVMEYVDGLNLRQLMETGLLTPEESLRIIPQICDALQYAHEEEIVHRDIKPENILLNQKGRVIIADFGLAKLLGSAHSGFTLTGSHQVMGTPFYMAPEQMQKAHKVDHRADIYSLGVVFYEMLTGELPMGRFAPPSHKSSVDRRLDEVIFRALEKEPDQRFQHISEVKSALESIAAGKGPVSQSSGRSASSGVGRPSIEAPRLRVSLLTHWSGTRHGLLELQEDVLLLEYDKGLLWGWFSNRFKEVCIPFVDLESVRLEKAWWQLQLRIRTYRLSTFGDIPNGKGGEATFTVEAKDRLVAEHFVAEVMNKIRGPISPQADWALNDPGPESPREPDAVAQQLRISALGLLLSGVVTSVFWFLILVVDLNNGPPHPGHFLVGFVMEAMGATFGFFMIFAALIIKKLESYPLAVSGAVAGLLPVSPAWILSCPMGIWVLTQLLRADTKAAFSVRRERGLHAVLDKNRFDHLGEKVRFEPSRFQVRSPALWLMITGIAAFCFWFTVMLVQGIDGVVDGPAPERVSIWLLEGAALVASMVIILGSVCLRNLEARPLVVVACVLAMLPWSPAALIGIPLGIWALLTVNRPEIRAAFHHGEKWAESNAPAPSEMIPRPTGPIRRQIRSILGSFRSLFIASRIRNSSPGQGEHLQTEIYQPEQNSEPTTNSSEPRP